MTLIRDLIEIPEQVHEGDFVLKLTQSVEQDEAERTVAQYEATPQLVEAFDDALGLIAGSIGTGHSAATYLHGSFGSGKSHFMAILHLLLQGNPRARGIKELHAVIEKWDPQLDGKRFLLVPLHFLTAKSMDASVLGGYVAHVQKLHPEASLPGVFLGDEILQEELPHQRELLGDDKLLAELNRVSGADDDDWGEFGTSWDLDRLERALTGNDIELRQELTAAYITAFRRATAVEAMSVGEGFINLDDGLSAISVHAASLGYDAVILFLDELILWLASHIGNLDFVQRESQKLTKLVESTNANRPIPLVSFVARQRDLRELVGDHIAGHELKSFADTLELQKGRFKTIKLEDRNLPLVAKKRVLRPVDSQAAQTLRSALDDALAGRDDIRQRLLTSDADVDLFRMVYPFSPASVQALIAVSEALQRERTALKVMAHLLVERRDDLELGELIPVGDIWDVVASGDEPFSAELRQAFETAQTLYKTKLRPMLLDSHDLEEDTPSSDPRWKAFKGDDRIIKSILLAALVERVEAFRNLDAAKLVALNWGSVTSPIPGRETTVLAGKLKEWNAHVGELRVGDDPANPSVAIALVNVDTEGIIERAVESFDTLGERRRTLRSLIDTDLDGILGDGLFASVDHLWRGTEREVDTVFGNIRDTSEMADSQLMSNGERPKIIIDFPFDDQGRSPEDDLERLDRFVDAHEPTSTVCWIPSFFNTQGLKALKTFVALNELLRSDQRYEQHTSQLSHTQRQEARPVLTSRRDQLRDQIRSAIQAAYGVTEPNHPLVDSGTALNEHFRSLDPSLTIKPTTEPSMSGAFRQLCDQIFDSRYPDHPRFEQKITPGQRRTTWQEVSRALGDPEGRVIVEAKNRSALRNVANPLGLGTMHESHFVMGNHWKNQLDRHIAAAKDEGGHLTVADVRAFIDQSGKGRLGLPDEIADLIVLTVAAQTDHALMHAGRAVQADGGAPLPSEALLVPQKLPDEVEWQTATTRAAHIFGIAASPMVSAPEVSRFADELKERASQHAAESQRLIEQLEVAIKHASLESSGSRYRTAKAAADLVMRLQGATDGSEAVRALVEADIPSSEPALGRSLSTARGVSSALADTNWNLLESAGSDVLEPLRSVLTNDELAQGYDEERLRLERQATDILRRAAKPDAAVSETGARNVEVRRVATADELTEATEEISASLKTGPVEISWKRLTNDG